MKLKEIGEFGFIERFARTYDKLISDKDTGIGDDCAVLSYNKNENLVITTDLLIEDVHFFKDRISPEQLGYKSLAVNLSDIAAMGAQPLYSFLSLGIPKDTDIEYLDAFMQGYQNLSEKFSTPLMGGDTTSSIDKIVVNVVVAGRVDKNKTRLRSMAKHGDIVCVSGNLGDSAAGLKIMLDDLENDMIGKHLIERHHTPEPMISEGIWLAEQEGVHAMMDISDGVASDLGHILKASEKSAHIQLDKIPLSPELLGAGEKHQWDVYELAVGGGEDYELLMTIDPKNFNSVSDAFLRKFQKTLFAIGEINEGVADIFWYMKEARVRNYKQGFNHFR